MWVLGNGPSLTDDVVRRAERDVLIVCNYFSRHPRWPDVDVDYYLWTEPREGILPEDLRYIEDTQGTGGCTWLVHESVARPPSIPMRFFGLSDASGLVDPYPPLSALVTDLNRPLLGNTTVVAILGIPLALWLGASRIVIAGVDLTTTGHFYGDEHPMSVDASWADSCNHRFSLWQQKCAELGVELINVTPSGNLSLPRRDWTTI